MIHSKSIKRDFPIFKNNPSLVYLDSAATSLKPQVVIDKLVEYYSYYCANIHRGIYKMSEKATEEYEATRRVVAQFINAPYSEEIIFTRSTTEAINLLAYSLGRQIVSKGDEIVTTIMEHHSNFVPWQMLAIEKGADFKVIDISDEGRLSVGDGIKEERNIITKKTKILALTYISNVLGTLNPVKEIIAAARKINPHIIVIVDGAQTAPHHKIDVQDLDCDFLAFSGHKMLGPTGVGVLWGRKQLLQQMPPFNFGGEMIRTVTLDKTTFAGLPKKFEAGTPHIAGAIGLGAAIKYIKSVGLDEIKNHEKNLARLLIECLQKEFGSDTHILGPEERIGIVTFEATFGHAHDVAQILDSHDIAVRAGHHCTMPLHKRLGVTSSTRVSFYIYNDEEDVEKLIEGLKKARNVLV